MAYDVTADLAYMLEHIPGAATVTLGAESAYGVFDHTDVIESDGDMQMQVRSPVLLLKRGALASLARGVTLVVDGTSYKVREVAREDDGAMVRCILVEL